MPINIEYVIVTIIVYNTPHETICRLSHLEINTIKSRRVKYLSQTKQTSQPRYTTFFMGCFANTKHHGN